MMNSRRLGRVFVSRELTSDSSLLKYLQYHSLSYNAFSLIDFTDVNFDIPRTEWLFFYSKKGVYFFLKMVGEAIKNYRTACYGRITAQYFTELSQYHCEYCGTAEAQSTAKELTNLIGDSSITFLKARNSLSAVERFMPDASSTHECIVYDNQPRKDVVLKNYDIAILTSPMNARNFLNFGGHADQYISIGPTTAKELNTLVDSAKIITCKRSSESGIMEILESL